MEGMREYSRDELRRMSIERMRAEATEYVQTFDRLLAELIEQGAEWDPRKRALVRNYLRDVLELMGIPRERGFEGLIEVRQQLAIEVEWEATPPTPTYPSKKEFQEKLLRVVFGNSEPHGVGVRQQLLATHVADFAHHEWRTVQSKNGDYTLDYLYELGKAMCSRRAYEVFFEDDPIVVGNEWQVLHGEHRALVLRTLGPEFVQETRMNNWVRVEKSPSR